LAKYGRADFLPSASAKNFLPKGVDFRPYVRRYSEQDEKRFLPAILKRRKL
jgi:hypothetical protein